MTNRNWVSVVCVLAALAAVAQPTKLTRQYVGSSKFSMDLPSKLGEAAVETVTDDQDWAVKCTDYAVETDRYVLQISVFEGKKGTKADAGFLKSVVKDVLVGLGSGKGTKVEQVGSLETKIDDKPFLKQTHRLTTDQESYIVKAGLLGDGTTVYMVLAICLPEVKGATEEVDGLMKSIRYKAGLVKA